MPSLLHPLKGWSLRQTRGGSQVIDWDNPGRILGIMVEHRRYRRSYRRTATVSSIVRRLRAKPANDPNKGMRTAA